MQTCKLNTLPPDESQAYHPSPLPEHVRDEVKQKRPHTMEPNSKRKRKMTVESNSKRKTKEKDESRVK